MSDGATTQLVVFADDWGRHPSSCQHLVSHLLGRYEVLWVNTIGTRSPGLSPGDVKKIGKKLKQWISAPQRATGQPDQPANLTVVAPPMWPGFRSAWQRRFNAWSISRSVNRTLGPRRGGQRRVAVTTIPVTADLIGPLAVDRWVYYCVDDFSVWPGVDTDVMQRMEVQQAGKVDAVVAASQTLVDRLASMGRPAGLLTHGIDLEHWTCPTPTTDGGRDAHPTETIQTEHGVPEWWLGLARPVFLFWGLIDTRLDTAWCRALVESETPGTVVLVGPQQSPDPALVAMAESQRGARQLLMPGPVAYDDLPSLAAAADVLVMPYADLPVTRAMQPLKLKEYLATGKPVVVSDLPATRPWSDAADVVNSAERFVEVASQRAAEGLPDAQRRARARLVDETWASKADWFDKILRS